MKTDQKLRLAGASALGALALTACVSSGPNENTAQGRGQALTESYFAEAETAVPYPRAEVGRGGWLDRRNINERLIRHADPTKISYIYLLSRDGSVVASYTIQGKVSATDSQLTATEIIVDACNNAEYCPHLVTAPGDEATYGPNEPGIFFFTTDGVMITWDGDYLLADAPQIVRDPVRIEYQLGSTPSNTSATVREAQAGQR